MEILIITGLSGGGKSRAASYLEDIGYYTVDNLPAEMMVKFADFCAGSSGRYDRVALVYDVRSGEPTDILIETLERLKASGVNCRMLFLEADNQTIVNRYKETRRMHPLQKKGESVEQAIRREREWMQPVRDHADFVLDTSALSIAKLRSELLDLFGQQGDRGGLAVNILSFGFKHGIPIEADLVFDVRFMPNPYYVPELKNKTGLDQAVRDFVFSFRQTNDFMEQLEKMLTFLLPLYAEEGKSALVIAIGCTGGHHRSVAVAAPPDPGPRIAASGGGTGLSPLLRGLTRYTNNITAIVTVADDGGGSGRLRQDLGMLPPGDIRNCLEALANAEPLMAQLMHYRFPEGELAGQSFGNLFLAALNGIMPSFDRAVESLSQVLAITGRVLPVTNENIQLEAEFENGVRVVGESRIFQCKQEQDCRIRRVNLLPSRPKALPEAVEAIREAEMVVLAPGSLYTSIIPNLLVDGIVEAIRESRALKIYVCNVMTQEGETEGYTASDHIRALFNHSCPGLFDLCLVNDAPIPPSVMRGYTREGAEPILCDRDACEALGVEVITRPVSTVENGLVRHNPGHLAWELVRLHAQRNIRLVEDSLRRTPRNRVEK